MNNNPNYSTLISEIFVHLVNGNKTMLYVICQELGGGFH